MTSEIIYERRSIYSELRKYILINNNQLYVILVGYLAHIGIKVMKEYYRM